MTLFVARDINVLIELDESTVFARLACCPEEVECFLDIELAST